MSNSVETPDWSCIPSPKDDGAAAHLPGAAWPAVALPATDGTRIDLSRPAGCTVVYAYPRTGQPGHPNPDGWDAIPGARGCTPQSCAFRDHYQELRELGVERVYGLSSQETAYQSEAVRRLHLPFALLSDARLELTRALALPTFEVQGMRLLKRMTLVVRNGIIEHVIYPVFPPDRNAAQVLEWLERRAA